MNESATARRALLIGIHRTAAPFHDSEASLGELAQLAANLGIADAGRLMVKLKEPLPKFLVGSGKAEEIKSRAEGLGADLLVFDEALSPTQLRNWERFSDLAVKDRHEIILDIFATRAATKEAQLQVELARLEFALPRLSHAFTDFAQQRGAAGKLMGAGETKLELDRRRILARIGRIKTELKRVRGRRSTIRRRRDRRRLPVGAVVGYTNAGKSSLLRALTGADLLVENKLFATLDPATRRVALPGGRELLLTDTVGFIRRLPHELVDAFKSTLEEVRLADFLVHVVDASDPSADAHIDVTAKILRELGAAGKPTILVHNKMDLVRAKGSGPATGAAFVACSARSGDGLSALTDALARALTAVDTEGAYLIPPDRHDLVALVHRSGELLEERYEDEGIRIRARVAGRTGAALEPFRIHAPAR